MNYRSYTDLYEDIKNNLHRLHFIKFDLVVGVPRSGMIPAYMIALALNVNCVDLQSFISNAKVSKGTTRPGRKELLNAWDAKSILLVDDSILSGKSMLLSLGKIPKEYPGGITTLAVYSSQHKRCDIDMFLEYVSFPRAFEWNIFHHGLLSRACVGMDGVLCVAPSEIKGNESIRYKDFLKNVKPYIVPVCKVHSIVTSRLEIYREQTERWLAEQEVEYENLIMLDENNQTGTIGYEVGVNHKANYYKESGLDFFIESKEAHAKNIFRITGKPVFCVKNNVMYNPALLTRAVKSPDSLLKELKRYAVYVPEPMRKLIRSFRSRNNLAD